MCEFTAKTSYRVAERCQLANAIVFAVLASTPRSDDCFIPAMTARRIAEESTPSTSSMMVSAADDIALGCLAAFLLCNCLAERGRVSEAWKLMGHAIRNVVASVYIVIQIASSGK